MSSLQKLGLNPKEEQVYLACLQLGESSASIIAARAKIKRPNAYVILEKLMERGFVSFGSKYGTKTFIALPPKDLLNVLQREQQKLSQNIDQFAESIPELEALTPAFGVKPSIRFYQGSEAMDQLYHGQMQSKNWFGFVDTPALIRSFGEDYFWKICEGAHLAGVKAQDLLTDCPMARKVQKAFGNSSYQIKIIKHPPLESDILIFEDRFFLVSYQEGMHLLIVENKPMRDMQYTMWKGLWDSC
ncbi:MAG TPA: helix-turn-helix domain-containing protein [Candidatus Gracilibacteria bacterium]